MAGCCTTGFDTPEAIAEYVAVCGKKFYLYNAIENGTDVDAMAALALFRLRRRAAKTDVLPVLKRAAQLGGVRAACILRRWRHFDNPVLEALETASAAGDDDATFRLATYDPDGPKYHALILKAADNGHTNAVQKLARIHREGTHSVEKSTARAEFLEGLVGKHAYVDEGKAILKCAHARTLLVCCARFPGRNPDSPFSALPCEIVWYILSMVLGRHMRLCNSQLQRLHWWQVLPGWPAKTTPVQRRITGYLPRKEQAQAQRKRVKR